MIAAPPPHTPQGGIGIWIFESSAREGRGEHHFRGKCFSSHLREDGRMAGLGHPPRCSPLPPRESPCGGRLHLRRWDEEREFKMRKPEVSICQRRNGTARERALSIGATYCHCRGTSLYLFLSLSLPPSLHPSLSPSLPLSDFRFRLLSLSTRQRFTPVCIDSHLIGLSRFELQTPNPNP